jgi:hypothetical protein
MVHVFIQSKGEIPVSILNIPFHHRAPSDHITAWHGFKHGNPFLEVVAFQISTDEGISDD